MSRKTSKINFANVQRIIYEIIIDFKLRDFPKYLSILYRCVCVYAYACVFVILEKLWIWQCLVISSLNRQNVSCLSAFNLHMYLYIGMAVIRYSLKYIENRTFPLEIYRSWNIFLTIFTFYLIRSIKLTGNVHVYCVYESNWE